MCCMSMQVFKPIPQMMGHYPQSVSHLMQSLVKLAWILLAPFKWNKVRFINQWWPKHTYVYCVIDSQGCPFRAGFRFDIQSIYTCQRIFIARKGNTSWSGVIMVLGAKHIFDTCLNLCNNKRPMKSFLLHVTSVLVNGFLGIISENESHILVGCGRLLLRVSRGACHKYLPMQNWTLKSSPQS